ncbi:MAG: 50S ribosomal protein L4 [Acidobacteria bacterium]|nr:50S ribosomal protein L4 [Acidobacteriota bacterium]NIM60816.1 50S ribosomal protein L4 [Acidobacteriota bacterium]NIQ83501.1 50S ribosomal protein L4 [Acidobacteriota bacterium]NIT09742.1 50S ribosomal protein L4 [Acidobacteriota bacterium]
MSEIQVTNWANKKLRKLELNPAVFDYPWKEHLVWEAVQAYQAAGRAGTHKTKNRRVVSGGSRKVWRQKGTGRARVGDNRSPLWRHGGTVHGPQPRDYSWKFPKKMRTNAIRSVLAQKLREGKLVCLDALDRKDPKTQALDSALSGKLGLENKTLLVPLETDQNLELAARNNPRVSVVRAMGVSVVDLLDCDAIVISEDAIKRLNEVLAP